MKWRQAVCGWLISQFCKNEKKWMDSRFDIEEKSGKKYVKSRWQKFLLDRHPHLTSKLLDRQPDFD